ncbi:hypothetical protein DAMA08_008560 [Martiniozyma asiatica (nom. inval.)]|nr:hypothetical protein DAMA08_008560 [Martiniozyma asiatica]
MLVDLKEILYNLWQRISYWFRLNPIKKATVDSLMIFPIKSFSQGFSTDKWTIDRFGLKGDRQFMLASWSKSLDRWERLQLSIYPQMFKPTVSFDDDYQRFVFKYNEKSTFSVPLNVTPEYINTHSTFGYTSQEIFEYHYGMDGYVLDKVLPSSFIEEYKLPKDTVLLYTEKGKDYLYPEIDTNGKKTKFHDYFPILIASKESYDDVFSRVSKDAPYSTMQSFRPNIVIKGLPAYSEDLFNDICFVTEKGKYWMDCPSHCVRCVIPNINVATGIMDKRGRVSALMSKWRRIDKATPSTCFGVYANNLSWNYEIKAGDTLEVWSQSKKTFNFNPWDEPKKE